MIQSCSPLEKFLSFLKEKTGKNVEPLDAVFHREFAKYRHLPYEEAEGDAWKANVMPRAWIDVILREGLSDELRSTLFPKRFDLGHSVADNSQSAKLMDLFDEINGPRSELDGQNAGRLSKHFFRTTLEGIKDTVGYDLSDSEREHPITSIRVLKRLYEVKSRRPQLFTLIGQPSERAEPTLAFTDPDRLIADLISYLSVEIPEDKLRQIHARLLTSPMLVVSIDCENRKIIEQVPKRCAGDVGRIVSVYHELAECVEEYEPELEASGEIPLDEALYTYLRTLEFRHYVRGFEKLVAITSVSHKIKDISAEIGEFCSFLSVEYERQIQPFSKEWSVNEFPVFVKAHEKKFRDLIASAMTTEVKKARFDEIIDQATKILSNYIWSYFWEKDLNIRLISLTDCIAALCAVSLRKMEGIGKLLAVQGEDIKRTSAKKYLSEENTIEFLQRTDFIPQAVNELMYRRFCRIHAYMIGQSEIHDAWMRFDLERLKKYEQCLQSCDIDSIIHTIHRFNDYCNLMVSRLLGLDEIGQWMNEDYL